ncbi:hypothetical protein [Herbaspirillum rubrisubalbicans]|uniref:hypothetical protein n=1 Tax=Herbaspirillum rubrisubalbicans TaxID=80842 RepID=UPI0015C559AA|nr:hypothetical protein [Herbaspirillum rubrisubalbicans]NQE51495.1 hypothetical protein [Herbaspirillum rubrisubalbicans]
MNTHTRAAAAMLLIGLSAGNVQAQSEAGLAPGSDAALGYLNPVPASEDKLARPMPQDSGADGTGFLNLTEAEDLAADNQGVFYQSQSFKGRADQLGAQIRRFWIGLTSLNWSGLLGGRDLLAGKGSIDSEHALAPLPGRSALERKHGALLTDSALTYLSPLSTDRGGMVQYTLFKHTQWFGHIGSLRHRSDPSVLTQAAGTPGLKNVRPEQHLLPGRVQAGLYTGVLHNF